DLDWGEYDDKGRPTGDGCWPCIKVGTLILPQHTWEQLVELLRAAKQKKDPLYVMFMNARTLFDEQKARGIQLPDFSPASAVLTQDTYGYRVKWEVLLASEAELCRLTNKTPKELKACKTLKSFKMRLDGPDASHSVLYPLSLAGLDPGAIAGMKRLELSRDVRIAHEEHFLSPLNNLTEGHGMEAFKFYASGHFEHRPGAGKVSGKVDTLKEILEACNKQAAAAGAAAASNVKVEVQPPSDSVKEEAVEDPSDSDSSTPGEKGKGRGKKGAQARPRAGLGSTAAPKAVPSRKPFKRKLEAQEERPRSKSPSVSVAAPSGSMVQAAKSSLKGNKKERERQAVLDELESKDEVLYKVASAHLKECGGAGVSCLLQLNLKHFFSNSKQGQATKIYEKLCTNSLEGAAGLLHERKAACEAAGIFVDYDIGSMKWKDFQNSLAVLEDHLHEMPVWLQIKVSQRVLTEKFHDLVLLVNDPNAFRLAATEFVTALFPVSSTSSKFELLDPSMHGLLAHVLPDKCDSDNDAGSSDSDADSQAKEGGKQAAAQDAVASALE
ncbi:unnamed protein product, partial [Symbiodinium microadriaticum]